MRNHHSRVSKNEFRCGYCKLLVSTVAVGTRYRNHCPNCGYSRHVDLPYSHGTSDCRGLMKPIGLTFKKNGELSLVHYCLSCQVMDRNRLSGDDNPFMLFDVYLDSLNLEESIRDLAKYRGIELIQPSELKEVEKQLGLERIAFSSKAIDSLFNDSYGIPRK